MQSSTGDRVIAIDIGGTFVRAGHASLSSGTVAAGTTISTERLRRGNPLEVLGDLIVGELDRLAGPASAIVVGVPGLMDGIQRTVVDTPNIKSLSGAPLAALLEEQTGLPVWLEHDAALATRGEYAKGAARGSASVLGVYFGTGVGAAFLANREPAPAGAFRMQLGHIPVRGEGRLCSCGAIDCVEPYASGLALMELARRHDVRIETVFTNHGGDDALAAATRRFIGDQAVAVATAITLLDPEVVLVGGGVPTMQDYPGDALMQEIRARLSPARSGSRLRIAWADLGREAVFHGAADLVVRRRGPLPALVRSPASG